MAREPTTGGPTAEPNRELKLLLETLGWSPERLARRLNAALTEQGESRRVHEKTPYRWLRGEVPHAPVPDMVVSVLAEAIGEAVPFETIWPPSTRRSLLRVPANHGLDVAWDRKGLFQLLEEWSNSVLTRRRFVAVSGAALTLPAWQWLDEPAPTLAAAARDAGKVSDAVLSLVEDIVVRAQQLDDQQGGAASAFVADQFACVSHLLRHASYTAPTGQRLCAALAQLAQTAGFMAYDARNDGDAQHWYLAGLHAAHAAGDRPLAGSVLGLMSNQATARGNISDALQLAAAAEEATIGAPAAVQALITARGGLAHAAAGDLSSFLRSRDRTLTMLDRAAEQAEHIPRWAKYVNRTELDAIAGRGLVVLADRVPARRARLLHDAETLLHDRALADASDPYQRSALRHGAWLSLAYTHAGDLDQAVTVGQHALARLPSVTSTRCIGLLHQLRADLARHAHRALGVRDLVADLVRELPAA